MGRSQGGGAAGAELPALSDTRQRHDHPEGYDKILDYIQSEIDAGKIVYVHCWGGKGRTCTVIGSRLIDGGLDYDAAIAELRRLRSGTKKAHHEVPDTLAQYQVLRDRAGDANRDDPLDGLRSDRGSVG